ncbi:DNA polymerase alpha, subunit B [Dendrothele bispora CBS 962.96]|uniref:DNA polymerase alpha subunit B n=1 Tax=Dendrothele bispora (strain CBS 962.96) TaxID=1314807 RepID=A0A4S8L229_DENBC|nr:DNA polymerase alpha, subunit B [Dendrothele bispora CBS 962.96]
MADRDISDEIARRMGEQVASDPKLLAECVNVCRIYNLTPEELQFKWEASTFSATPARAHELVFTLDSLQTVKQKITRERTANITRKTNPRNAAPVLTASKRRLPAFMNRGQPSGTDLRTEDVSVKSEYIDSGISPSYDDGTGPSTSSISFEGPRKDEWKERAYRYMYERPGERGDALDDKIDEVAELIRDYYKVTTFGDPSLTNEEIIVVGRIVHDQENSSFTAKLTDANLAIETSRILANGARVPVRLEPGLKIRGCVQGAGGYSLFPGAIVGLKGRNGGGSWFSASEIIVPPPMKVMPSLKREPGAFSMYIGCGPFTPDTDLDYKPWRTLLKVLKNNKPSVVVLIGPFVDSSHPHIAGGEVDETPLVFFRRIFLKPLSEFLSSSPTSLAILIPSIRDLISSHVVFPQCEFGLEVSTHARIKLLPNPSVFSINGIRFSASSVDVLFHLKTQELPKRGEEVESVAPVAPDDSGSDTMGNLCRHILQQRSFYPLFPVPLDVSNEVNLDVTHSKGLNIDENPPDVLILPSKLKQFSKRVQVTQVINPSSLLKGIYATVEVSGENIRTGVLKMENE